MGRFHSYLNSAVSIIEAYNGAEPFASFLKKYFSANKKFGSKDRKQVSHLCYCFFRLGKAGEGLPVHERIITGLFLCSGEPNEVLATLKPEWNEKVTLNIEEKFSIVNGELSMGNVFPWKEQLSEGIDHLSFTQSFFIQPDLFLRLRPGKEKLVKQKLDAEGIAYAQKSESCLELSNAAKVDTVVELNKEVIVQDYSSQRTIGMLDNYKLQTTNDKLTTWDCCAASGGKSILLYDRLSGKIDLTVSDVRESILQNLKKRFAEAGIKNYHAFVADLSRPVPSHQQYDLIIADVPCTGSGTWSRTPEQLYYFDKKKIADYAGLQKKIVTNVAEHIKPGGYFLYITCSVFKQENEETVACINENLRLQLLKTEVLKGYDQKADSMFTALFQRPL